MLSYTLFSIPKSDAFWTADEEPLPVEKGDYVIRFEAPRMIVTGTKSSGQVRWIQARNVPKREPYRDKYTKLVCSSHFPFNVLKDPDHAPWDQAVVFRDAAGKCATRLAVTDGKLIDDGVETTWTTKLGETAIAIVTTVRLAGEFELRQHVIQADKATLGKWTLVEGSHALPLASDETPTEIARDNWRIIRNRGGYAVATWNLDGYGGAEVATSFGPRRESRVNILHPKTAVLGLSAQLASAATLVFTSLHFASPKPPENDDILRRAGQLLSRWKSG
jgi:hypothetical protein